MEDTTVSLDRLAAVSRRLATRLLTVCENRIALVTVELQEERERLLRTVVLATAAAGFVMLAVMALSAAVVLLLWHWSPLGVLLGLAGLYAAIGGILLWIVATGRRTWRTLSATREQFRKDRLCLEGFLA